MKNPGHGERRVPSQIPQERDGAGAPPSCHVECHLEEMAPCPGEQLGKPTVLVLFRLVDGPPFPATPRHTPTRQRRDDGGVNGDLLASPQWKAVDDDLNPALVICRCHGVEIAKQLVLLHASTCFRAGSGHATPLPGSLAASRDRSVNMQICGDHARPTVRRSCRIVRPCGGASTNGPGAACGTPQPKMWSPDMWVDS